MRKCFFLAMLLMVIGPSQVYAECPSIGNVLNWRNNNFATVVPADKYPFDKIYPEKRGCPPPNKVRVPNSVPIIDKLLLDGSKVTVFVVTSSGMEPGNTLEAECEGLLIQIFGNNSNFAVVDRSKLAANFSEISLGQTGLIEEKDIAKAGKLLGATHIYKIAASVDRSNRGPFKTKTVYFAGRLIELQTGRVLAVDKLED